ncbi:putative general amino acid permease [Triangularia setosa]|uniref:General amino acid permease n=1 Tax=Triangularia setosa TaxID=2587417 RepID=A0AAN7A2T3_9PEZI|nr:putative general amino acid permease [Podospora setosa]
MGLPSFSLRGKRGEDVSVSKKGSDDGVAGIENSAGISGSDSDDFAAIDPNSGVKRGLKTRHLSMMALAGIIGPGLLIGSGRALANGGPAALLIGFGVIGIIAFSIMQSLGELTTLYPTGGAFTGLSDRFVDKAFGVAVGWNYFIIWFCVLANEYNVISSIMVDWTDAIPIWGWFLIFWFSFTAFQMLGVETFGEAEFWLALFKLVGLIAFFFFSLIYASGGVIGAEAIGFSYWRDPGAFTDGFRGVASVFVFCSTFYAGVESVAVAATETRNPRRAVPLAIRQVFIRIVVVYMGSAFFFGLVCPANSPDLTSATQRALRSPMTIAIANAGWEGGKHLINAFILVTCLSAVNSSIFIGSRTILFMAQTQKAPKFLGWTNKRGVPVPAIIFTNLFGALSMMNVSTGAQDAYSYIVNLSGVSTFLVWAAISWTHIRFRKAWAAQGHSDSELPFKSMLYPYNAWFGLSTNIFLALIQGWATFAPFDAVDFVDAYILLPLFGVIYVVYKFWNKTKTVNIHTVDLHEGRRKDLDDGRRPLADGEEIDSTLPWHKKLWKSL